ncbi:MAG: HPr family phosphocarrier protein [Candidatus Viridilinea halotolerans]|uniref:HPr family phosphocarrier protein n=1 Tax=Candidatus Viridilinea halotolerans TaxID=2491704 RepID=A0A426TSN2_9CHLR|nr:MAG: HPr family phosphocarrier protein [Candidatus Viridilinea halotolerans]
MIAILIVSHSALLAQGVQELAAQMVKGRVPIMAVGGTHDGALGTSVDLISAALQGIPNTYAILAFVDMGSAIMSTEMALESAGHRFLISSGPLVEGALIAAVEAMRPDVTLAQVAAVATRALETKYYSINPALPPPTPPSAPSVPTAETVLTLTNKTGLHMRPAKDFVQTATRFSCTVHIRNLDRPERPGGDAKSMLDVMKIGLSLGQRIHIHAQGSDACAAIAALSQLITSNFGEH